MKEQEKQHFDCVIAGGGIAGLVSALELVENSNKKVCIVDRDTQQRLGGLARWAFGGMALCNTKQQQRSKIQDSAALMLQDWHQFAQFEPEDDWPRAWANEYAQNNHEKVYCWLQSLGLGFLPAVNWVERGLFGSGNSVPRYHVLWGTGWELVERVIKQLEPYVAKGQLSYLHQHKIQAPVFEQGRVSGATVLNEQTEKLFELTTDCLIIACGGINGAIEQVRKNWYKAWGKAPLELLNGANPISDGMLHHEVLSAGGMVTHSDKMWNYAAGISHPQAEFEGHGLSLIPSKSALWLNHRGQRIGPMPLVTGFDTRYLCEQVSKQEKPWTWQIMNWKIAKKELAVSGAMHNPSIRDKKLFGLLKETLFGNERLVKQLELESDDFLVADTLEQLVIKMNQATEQSYIEHNELAKELESYDSQLNRGSAFENDEQARRITHARQWKVDRLRTCKSQAIIDKKAGPLIAIKLQLISRKSLGGIQTNLQSQVLNEQGQWISGLYSVGEAAGFGGGGASGLRSLEGTFLSGCILTARNAAQSILENN